MSFEQMTPYEQRAWRPSIELLYESPSRRLVPAGLRSRATGAASFAAKRAGHLPGADGARARSKELLKAASR